HGLPTPRSLRAPSCFEELDAVMRAYGMARVFFKLRYGAAAAGMMALARNGGCWRAWTTARIGADGLLYSPYEVELVTDPRQIARLVDRMAPLMVHVEQWVPKFGMHGETVDLRIVVGDGKAIAVVRGSRHPMTNLHLGGARSAVHPLVARIGPASWREVL